MSMYRRAILLLGPACLLGAAACCNQSRSQGMAAKPSGAAPAPHVEEVDAGAMANDELAMFGRGPAAMDVAFEARAATDLRQHTEPSEGSDFDVDVDAAGKALVFASTRHSRNSHLYIKTVDGATMTQLTDGPGNDAQPCFDPTGTRVAFTSDRSGNWDIWVVDVTGRNAIQITNSPSPELNPTWSPDGSRIAYCRLDPREDRGSLWIAELANPGVKRLIGEGMFPAWSPAGDKIAYQRARARSGRWYSIWTLDIRNDEVLFPTEVASSPRGALVTPVWSTDGQQLAFCMISSAESGSSNMRGGAAVADVGIVDVDGRGMHCVTDGQGECYAPAWSPDGRVYFSRRLDGTETLWSMKPLSPGLLRESPAVRSAGVRRAEATGSAGDIEP